MGIAGMCVIQDNCHLDKKTAYPYLTYVFVVELSIKPPRASQSPSDPSCTIHDAPHVILNGTRPVPRVVTPSHHQQRRRRLLPIRQPDSGHCPNQLETESGHHHHPRFRPEPLPVIPVLSPTGVLKI